MDRKSIEQRARQLGAVLARGAQNFASIHARGFADRVVERALKIQIAFLVLLVPLTLLGPDPSGWPMALFLSVQTALTWVALIGARRRDPVLGAGLYALLAAVTFVEAKQYTGLQGAIFSLEAILSLIAAWYIVVLVRRRDAPWRPFAALAPVLATLRTRFARA
ncbi:MAG: hypothetical protein AAF677_07845 [Pseudomonadota bacterium]